MPRHTSPPRRDKHGRETHPAFGLIEVGRMSSTPGQVLFDSDIRHSRTIRLTISRADRRRDLHHDYIFGTQQLIEVEMSEAQWASLVSSMNTSGVPCTLRRTEGAIEDELPYDPRLAHSMEEVRQAGRELLDRAKAALADYEAALANKAPAKVRNRALDMLRASIANAEGNMAFAASSLSKHAEDVVQRARADIEAMVGAHAERLGLSAGDAAPLALPLLAEEDPATP